MSLAALLLANKINGSVHCHFFGQRSLVIFILPGICSRHIPAEHTAGEHSLLLSRCNAATLVVVIGKPAILSSVLGAPLAGVVTTFPALDADQSALAGKYRPAKIRKAGEGIRSEFFFFCLDAPAAWSSKGSHRVRPHPARWLAVQTPRPSHQKPVPK